MQGASCRFNVSSRVVSTSPSAYAVVADNSDQALMSALGSVGPVSAAVCIDKNFQFYSGGVYRGPVCTDENMNHAVLVVGYGNDPGSGATFWLVKNSWGVYFGEQGYIRMARGSGLVRKPVYPIV